jgi:hypothetical protein
VATQDIKRGYHIINKSGGAIKYLNKRAKEESWYGGMYRWLDGDVPKGIETSMNRIQIQFGYCRLVWV